MKKNKLNILPENPDKQSLGRFPKWLHRKLPRSGMLRKTGQVLSDNRLPTVCEEARCPNLLECWSKKTATFLVMGKQCTRACGFCDIDFAKTPPPLAADEPERVAQSVAELGLKHVVITMVARDDLDDGGAEHLAEIVRKLRQQEVTIELLTSDFQGNLEAIDKVLETEPDIFNHNIETVRRLTPRVRHKATYERTLKVLAHAQTRGMVVKSGLMVGLGESVEEVYQTIEDLHGVGCQIITIGQYLQPNARKLRVQKFVTPETFEHFATFGKKLGVKEIYSGPFVRSSYNAASVFERIRA